MKVKLLLITGILLIAASVLVYTHPWQVKSGEDPAWNLTLVGVDGEQKILTRDEITAMSAYTGHGGFFTTVGVVNGPYTARGIPLTDLCELVGGVTPSDIITIYAIDGYSTVLDYDHIMGNFITYNPQNLKEVPHGELKPILMYEQDGKPLSQENGKPLRIAVVGTDGLLVEGHYWTKWVNKIEVVEVNQSNVGKG
jgi:DMSO/TMAO reductase YedYZ molybdopterin-dependent catalytic subunit